IMPRIDKVAVRVPASTANLGPGFDCLGLALRLYNKLTLERSAGKKNEIVCGGRFGAEVDDSADNLVVRSAAHIFRMLKRPMPPLRFRLSIDIPLARGLGSSGTAIIGGCEAANALLGSPLSRQELFDEIVALEGHPDNVAASFYGGLTAAMRAGDRSIVQRYAPSPRLRAVLAIPNYELSTKRARAAMPKKIAVTDAVANLARVPLIVEALRAGDLRNLSVLMEDRMHVPYRKPLIRAYDKLVEAGLKAGAGAVTISGAGPSVVGFCIESAEAVAMAFSSVFHNEGIPHECAILSPDSGGTKAQVLR
ncbi:MAG: homoserine kinase, partial [bacterium]